MLRGYVATLTEGSSGELMATFDDAEKWWSFDHSSASSKDHDAAAAEFLAGVMPARGYGSRRARRPAVVATHVF